MKAMMSSCKFIYYDVLRNYCSMKEKETMIKRLSLVEALHFLDEGGMEMSDAETSPILRMRLCLFMILSVFSRKRS
jgi:hypothetical protein